MDNLCNHPTPQTNPLALKKEATNQEEKEHCNAKAAGAKAKGASQCNAVGDASMKRKLSTTELDILKEWEDEWATEKVQRKRVHSKAYHAAFKLARRDGKGAEEAKGLARKAGADATRVWAENCKK